MTLISINPSTGDILQRYEEMPVDQVALRIESAQQAFEKWRRNHIGQRAERMRRLAEILRQQKASLAALITAEMGKPIRDSHAEIDKCAWVCEYYARHTEIMLAPEAITTDAATSYVTFEPLGVILGVMPWNYPFWQLFRFAVPSLMAGNAVLLKHASNVCGCSLSIQQLFETAGFPEDLFQSLLVSSGRVGALIDHPLVRGVSLTGSSEAGKAVAAAAGKQIKKVVLELGGSDPYVILEDTPLPETVEACVAARLLNSGQSCIAAKRFVVVRSLREAFENALVSAMGKSEWETPWTNRWTLVPRHDRIFAIRCISRSEKVSSWEPYA
jgi:succinate-semialdehyde dehydrogenase / glutarate-semialdehyde dehydrogenase